MAKVSVVIPSYNEEENVSILAQKLVEVFSKTNHEFEAIFVNDGSKDHTLEKLQKLNDQDPKHFHYISFSKNFGHQNALRAGLKYSTGDCVISMDADLQHPPEMIPQMLGHWDQGTAIVYTIRQEEEGLSLFKRLTSNLFYTLINGLSGLKLEKGTADFRLLDRKVVAVLNELTEPGIFYRGVISSIGFKRIALAYQPGKRLHGKSQFTLKKMLNLALNGITGFSTFPLRLSTWMGVIIAGGAFLYSLYALLIKLFVDYVVPGWSSVLVGVYFLGGVQLLMIGVLGEYLGRLFIETKRRPNYIVEDSSF